MGKSALYQKLRSHLSGKLRVKKSVFVSFVFSYVAILLIPLACSGAIFFHTRKGVQQEMLQTNRAILIQTSQVIDNAMETVRTFCLDLSMQENIASILYIRPPFDVEQRYNISTAIRKDLKSSAVKQFVNGYFIYFNRGQFVLTPSASYTPELAYREYFSHSVSSFTRWEELMQTRHYQELYDLGSSLLYLQTIPYTGSEATANIAVVLDKAHLMDQISQIEWVSRGMFFMTNEEGKVILSNQESAFASLDFQKEANGVLTGTFEGKPVYASRQPSSLSGWDYCLVMDSRYLDSANRTMNGMFWLYLLAAATLGLLLAFLFSRRNYQPIREVVHTLQSGQSMSENENELWFIDASVKRMLHRNADIQRRLEIQGNQLRQNFLSRILRGRVNLSYLDEAALQENHLAFPYSSFLVALFQVDDCSGFFADTQAEAEEYPLDSMDYSLVFLLQELLQQRYAGYVCEVNGAIACIVNFSEGEEAVIQSLREAREFVAQSLYIFMTMAVGGTHKSLVGIRNAYDEACVALDHAVLGTGGREFFYSASHQPSSYGYSTELEQALGGNLRSGNIGQAKELLKEIFHSSLEENQLTPELYRCFLFDVAATFIRVIEGLDLEGEELGAGWIVTHVSSLSAANQVHGYFDGLAEKICEQVDAGKESHNTALLRRIQEYLRENYADSGLSNDQIAQAMDISPAYLSRFFKQQTGEGLLNTINRIRIEESKKLLIRKENQTLSEICRLVGFDNTTTFIRIFKKIEGVTPGKYAELQSLS